MGTFFIAASVLAGVISLIALLGAMLRAPVGYEDENGFHPTESPAAILELKVLASASRSNRDESGHGAGSITQT